MGGETIDHSTNDFEVIGLYGVGGIVGTGFGSNLYRVANFANVYGIEGVGGIVGVSESLNLNEGYNSGNIGIVEEEYYLIEGEPFAIRYFGGLIGESNDSYVQTSMNTGEVTGEERVGGLIGVVDYSTKLIESINIGLVSLDNEDPNVISVGNIIGYLDISSNSAITDIVANLSLNNSLNAIGEINFSSPDEPSDYIDGFSIKEISNISDL
jgi:hypothetical protein